MKSRTYDNQTKLIAAEIKMLGFSNGWETISDSDRERIICELSSLGLPCCYEANGEWRTKLHDFCDDNEKMLDFFLLTKDEFLAFYSYMTEYEYDLTVTKIKKAIVEKFYQQINEVNSASDGKMLKGVLDTVRNLQKQFSK